MHASSYHHVSYVGLLPYANDVKKPGNFVFPEPSISPALCTTSTSTTMTTSEPPATPPPNPLSRDWAGLLDSCRKARGKSSPLTFGAIQQEFLVHLAEVTAVIQQYSAIADIEGFNEDISESKRADRKGQILAVRNALRFAISCLSLGSSQVQIHNNDVGGNSNSIRCQIQKEAVVGCNLHHALARALQCRDMDSKSQLLAARLLSNLVTGNAVTAKVVLKDIAPSSTEEYRTKKLLASMALSGNNVADGSESGQMPNGSIEYNWADMIVCAARAGGIGREILSAIVAALFNSTVAIQEDQGGSSPLFASIASDKGLICACVRHILPADIIKQDESKDDEQAEGTGDDATEWISIFLTKLSCYGHFPSLYEATGVNHGNRTSTLDEEGSSVLPTITPEQIVLLHCIASALDEWTTDTSSKSVDCPIGGASGQQAIIKSCQFLANESKSLQETVRGGELSSEAYSGERACRLNAYLSVLEMLATMLSSDDSSKSKDHVFCRIFLGKETTLLSDVIMELGALVDDLSAANRGIKARELKIDSQDQRLAVACVRLIGNICYKCPSNQDKVRETEVPFPGGMPAQAPDGTAVVRCGLHVLLSCTSFSYGCFTLREWALVAIRNVLDGNQQNQDMVAQLEAQKTVATPELNKMGVKTVIDDQGKVRVEPRG